MKTFAVTGTFNGSIIHAKTEGEARQLFHKKYNGESIINCFDRSKKDYWKNIIKKQQELK